MNSRGVDLAGRQGVDPACGQPDRHDAVGDPQAGALQIIGAVRRVDVLWLVEHVARELDVACAASLHLADRYGRSVVIAPIVGSAKRVRAVYDPSVIVMPYCYSDHDAGLRDFVHGWSRAPIFFNLSWEELYYDAYRAYKAPRDAFSRERVFHHAWGDFFKEYLMGAGVPEDHIRVNGQPAYALYDEPYRRRFKTRDDLAAAVGLDMGKRWIFFPENYRWAFFGQSQLEEIIAGGMLRSDADAMRKFCRASLVRALAWMVSAARDGSVEVIIRPRPATDLGMFVRVIQALVGDGPLPAALHVTKTESVRDWLMASDFACSSYSTSLIEAAVTGKPAYMLEPIPLPAPLEAAWHERIARVKTRDEFMNTFLAEPDVSTSKDLGRWARSEMLGRGDPIAGLAGIIDALCPSAGMAPKGTRTIFGPQPGDVAAVADEDRFTQDDIDVLVRSFEVALGTDGRG